VVRRPCHQTLSKKEIGLVTINIPLEVFKTPVVGPQGQHTNAMRVRAILRLPLLQKLVMADVLISVVSFLVMAVLPRSDHDLAIMVSTLLLTVLLNGALVYWNLLPLLALESTAARVAKGDWCARVPTSEVADKHIHRIGQTFNALLDRLLEDQGRLKYLSAQAIGAADAERAHLARELHDSTAQSLSAVEMLLSALTQSLPPSNACSQLKERLEAMRDIVSEALHEVRTLSHRVHPSALEHLGLTAALELLLKRTLAQSGIRHGVHASVCARISPQLASVFYRVAQEAIGNAMRHGEPGQISIRLDVDRHTARLSVQDDGMGFDLDMVEQQRAGMGLFVMRERLMLISGELVVSTRPGGGGTMIHAVAPNVQEQAA
jgi:signal transduction histidine kinase